MRAIAYLVALAGLLLVSTSPAGNGYIYQFSGQVKSLTALTEPQTTHGLTSPVAAPKFLPQIIAIDPHQYWITWLDPRNPFYTVRGIPISDQGNVNLFDEPIGNASFQKYFQYRLASNLRGRSLLTVLQDNNLYFQWLEGNELTPTSWQLLSKEADSLWDATIHPDGSGAILFENIIWQQPTVAIVQPDTTYLINNFDLGLLFTHQSIAANTTNQYFIVGYKNLPYSNDKVILITLTAPFIEYNQLIIDNVHTTTNAKIVSNANGRFLIVWKRRINNISPFTLTGAIYHAATDSLSPFFTIREIPENSDISYALTTVGNSHDFVVVVSNQDTLETFRYTSEGELRSRHQFTFPTLPEQGAIGQIIVPRWITSEAFLPILVEYTNEAQFQLVTVNLSEQTLAPPRYVIPDSLGAAQIAPLVAANSSGDYWVLWKDYRKGYPVFRTTYFDSRAQRSFYDQALLPATKHQIIETAACNTSGNLAIVYAQHSIYTSQLIWQFVNKNNQTISHPDTFYTGGFTQMRLSPFQNNYLLSVRWRPGYNGAVVSLHQTRAQPVFTKALYLNTNQSLYACTINEPGNIAMIYQDNNTRNFYYKIMTFLGETVVKPRKISLPPKISIKYIFQAEMDSLNHLALLVILKYFLYTTNSHDDFIPSPERKFYWFIRPTKNGTLIAPITSESQPRLQKGPPGIWLLFTSQDNQVILNVFNDNLRTWNIYTIADMGSQWLRYSYSGDGFVHGDTLFLSYETPFVTGSGIDVVHQQVKAPASVLATAQLPQPQGIQDMLYAPFPNPARDELNVIVHMGSTNHAILEIFNVQGKLVQTVYNGLMRKGNHLLTIRTTDLPSGVYFIRLRAFNTAAQKFVVVH